MKVNRRVKRNIARAIAGRTFNEKRMKQQVFYQGIKYGVEMERSRLLSSTAHLTYTEEITNEVTTASTTNPVAVADGVPVVVEAPTGSDDTCPHPEVFGS